MNMFLYPTKSYEIKRGVSDYPGETAQAEACGSVVLALLMRIVLLSAITAAPVLGQPTFDSGSDGSDGALDLTGQSGVVIFDPVALGLDLDRDNVFHFTTITIPAGVTLRMRGLELQFAGVYWLASGAVQIDGTIDLSGEDGHDVQLGNRRPSMPGPGGFPGGVGVTADSPPQPGLGPGGGSIRQGGSHATGVTTLGCTFDVAQPPYGNLFLIPLTGGSGGGGTDMGFGGEGGGGAAGGGALLIASTESIRVDGAIRADGGDTTEFCGGRGAGGGIRLLAPIISGQGTVSANTGLGPGGDAGLGRVRIETVQNDFTGSILGVSRIATLSPHAIILPDTPISAISLTQIAGIAVPVVPMGSFLDPDVTIDSSVPVELVIEATNLPTDAGLKLSLYPETSPDRIIAAFFVSGDDFASTWAASATFPNGFSRTFVSATWAP